ncbi:OmpA family protein [Anatilimnocola floriformis]|uniref:OmpA family protein n=1 Tax=Anatilimnocola floriformis TaxID=2948575 RepID=UPI0020C2475F|nr:OmpA family protein [Anatilimnocola floriformis]
MKNLIICVALLTAVLGCASPNAQVRRVEDEKEQLKATIRMQRDQNRTLQTQVAGLETRLDEAETQLAGGKRRTLTQDSASGTVTSPLAGNTRARPKPQPAEESLSWRPHRGATSANTVLPAVAQLARQDERIAVDPETGAGVWSPGVTFEPNKAALTPQGRQQLQELARVLQKQPANKFRVLVATSAERTGSRSRDAAATSGRKLAASRAQSVADYLDGHGIAEDRLAIASTGVRKNTREQHGLPADGVEDVRIYLVDPEQPVLGWLQNDTVRR